MESSRIYVQNLPLGINSNQMRHHFSKTSSVTDIRHIPDRRMCYVGYQSTADAAKAVEYFNKSFIQTSRLVVKMARPIEGSRHLQPHATAESGQSVRSAGVVTENTRKRKRDDGGAKSEDLGATDRLSKSNYRANQDKLHVQADSIDDTIQALHTAPRLTHRNEQNEVDISQRKRDSEPDPALDGWDATDSATSGSETGQVSKPNIAKPGTGLPKTTGVAQTATDNDWLRSRTIKSLGLIDDEEARTYNKSMPEQNKTEAGPTVLQRSPPAEMADAAIQAGVEAAGRAENLFLHTQTTGNEDPALASGRLFVRNLAYSTTEADLRSLFESYDFGPIEEVHLPVNHRSGDGKGYAYVQYSDPEAARTALDSIDGTSFQGRLLHIIAAAPKKQAGLDEFTLAKLPLRKQQQIKRKVEAASSMFNWNSLFMNADAVMSSISKRLGVPKAQILDPTSSDAAIKQAHAETHIIQDTKLYFAANGVNLDAFKKAARGDTTILVKNFSYETKPSDLKALFDTYGPISRLLVPPSGTIAIVEFTHADDARSAFAGLAYRKIKDSILFLEKAPRNIFSNDTLPVETDRTSNAARTDFQEGQTAYDALQSSTLFVRNLNFSTSTQRLHEVFRPFDGFRSARVKQKPDPKKAGHLLSMGFGFVEFGTKQQAHAALAAMDGYNLDGHKLLVRSSHKGIDATEERKIADKAKKSAERKTKVIIKNLPFEASRKDVRFLLGPYGQLRSVRVPKKFDTSTRGFAFAEFVTAKEAENALDALKDTHLLGRKLVFEFAAEDTIDPEHEIAEMQKKVGKQADKVALQRLTGTGRKKFNVEAGEEQ